MVRFEPAMGLPTSLTRCSLPIVAAGLAVLGAHAAEPTPTASGFGNPARRAQLEAAFPGIEKSLRQRMQDAGIPGLAYGIVIDSELAEVRGLGLRNVSSGLPVQADTVFPIAPLPKSFIALAVLHLRDQGRHGHLHRYHITLATATHELGAGAEGHRWQCHY
jgi:CubicO group peptidase (beta-lactamase class C family)